MSTTSARVIELNLYPQYFDLVAAGRKTREVRVKYPKFEGLAAGDLIRFSVKNTDRSCLTRVTRVAATNETSEDAATVYCPAGTPAREISVTAPAFAVMTPPEGRATCPSRP